MSHWVHGIEWFEAEGEVSRGWVWERQHRRRNWPWYYSIELERARCRAILLRFFSSDWNGCEALRLIDSGRWS